MQSTPSMPLERSRQALHAPPRCAAEWGGEAVEIPKPKRPAVHLGVSTRDRLGHLGSCSQRRPRAAGEKSKAFGTGHCGSSSQSCPRRTILQVGWVAKLRTPPRRKTQPRLVPAKPRNSACMTFGAQPETMQCVCCVLTFATGREVRKRLQQVLASRPAELQHVQRARGPRSIPAGSDSAIATDGPAATPNGGDQRRRLCVEPGRPPPPVAGIAHL